MITFSCSALHLFVGLLIIFLTACSGGGNGGTGHNNSSTGTLSTIGSAIEDESLMVPYTLPPADDDAIFMIPASYTSDGRGDIIVNWEMAYALNYFGAYEIFYTRSKVMVGQ